MTTKKDHPPRMMTSKEDYDHKNLDDYLNELLSELNQKKQLPNKKQ
jgi:PHD/YefM family antitoxin component YafN of YafNO toxin-antitoxin module|tara:strand:- start:9 stop:146 length:138 start_codon:yes stop_codon:yes gene_type:complete